MVGGGESVKGGGGEGGGGEGGRRRLVSWEGVFSVKIINN